MHVLTFHRDTLAWSQAKEFKKGSSRKTLHLCYNALKRICVLMNVGGSCTHAALVYVAAIAGSCARVGQDVGLNHSGLPWSYATCGSLDLHAFWRNLRLTCLVLKSNRATPYSLWFWLDFQCGSSGTPCDGATQIRITGTVIAVTDVTRKCTRR